MRRIHDFAGDPPLRRYPPGFEGVARIVVGQQLSLQSAEAIWRRTRRTVAPFTPRRLLALDDGTLRSAGLSRPKIRTLRELAARAADGRVDFDRLAAADEDEVHSLLTAVPGIGPWTADIFLLFCAGRADAWAPGDLALQIAVQMMRDLPDKPGRDALAAMAEDWRPWRGVAAHLLWAYYKVAKRPASGSPLRMIGG